MYEIYFDLTLISGNLVACTPTNQHLTFALGYLHTEQRRQNLVDHEAPKNWSDKRRKIDDRITMLARNSVNTASIEELPDETNDVNDDIHELPFVSKKKRLDIVQREQDIGKVLKYNILKRKEHNNINDWKSYPGISKIIDMARDMMENGNKDHIGE